MPPMKISLLNYNKFHPHAAHQAAHQAAQNEEVRRSTLSKDKDKSAIFEETNKLAEQMKPAWDQVFAFTNAMRKKKKHPGAIFLALTQVALHNPKVPWPYAKNIVEVESQNFYEQDHTQESEQYKEKR